MTLRYLLDENGDFAYQTQLLKRDPSLAVLAVGDPGVPPKSTLDPDILDWCELHDCVPITNSRSSMPVHLADHIVQGWHIPAISILNANLSMGQMLDNLLVMAQVSPADKYQDLIIYLPATVA